MSSVPDLATARADSHRLQPGVVHQFPSAPRTPWTGVAVLAAYILCGIGAIYMDAPPAPAKADAAEFSLERAMYHVRTVSREPHPVGSPAHDKVRDYILQVLRQEGYAPEVQTATATNKSLGQAATIENIAAVLKGAGNGKAVMLAAHYDSVFTGPGAADDGAAVATLLETARILKSRPQFKRDVVFLFTDGEEIGLQGARAFVSENRLAQHVGTVLNFEARGTRGPVIIFESSDHNGWLIDKLAHAAARPVANSLSYEIYKRLPNDTDFTVFKQAGYSGLNFAFIDGVVGYHTYLDNARNLDPASLQHHASYAVSLAAALAGADADDPRRENAVYFDVLGLGLVRYSKAAAVVLALFSAFLAGVVLRSATGKRIVAGRDLPRALAVIVAAIASAVAVAFTLSWGLGPLAAVSERVRAALLYHDDLLTAAFVALALAAESATLVAARNRVSFRTSALTALAAWPILLVAASLFLPGSSYLLLWPLVFCAGAWLLLLRSAPRLLRFSEFVLVAAVAPAVVLTVPLVHKVFTAFGNRAAVPAAVLLSFVLTLMLWQLAPHKMPHPWFLPGVLLFAATVFGASGLVMSQFDKAHPKFDSLFYAADADSEKQVWASHDDRPDEWTSRFLSGPLGRAPMPDFFPGSPQRFLQAPAPRLPFAPPSLVVTSDETSADRRRLRVRITSGRGASLLSVLIENKARPSDVLVNGKSIDLLPLRAGTWLLQYYGARQDPIDLEFYSLPGTPVRIRVEDISSDLMEQTAYPVPPRPEAIVPTPNRFNNTVVIMKSFTL